MSNRSRNRITLDNISPKSQDKNEVPTPHHDVRLTPREFDVSCMLALENVNYKTIGKCLGISYRTVETYITTLRRKFHCATKLRLHYQLKTIKQKGSLSMSPDAHIELKSREAALLKQLVQGTEKEAIAELLEISIHTLSFYLQVLLLKFDCKTEAELIQCVKNKYYAEIL